MAGFETITLEKGMYAGGKSLTQVLEKLDDSSLYAGTPLEGLDAFQRQLKRFDIRVSGAGSDTVEKFFQTSQSAALFPEYVSRAVKQGMEQADKLQKIVATTTKINSLDYRTIIADADTDSKSLKAVAEGASLPSTVIHTQDNLVRLMKRGRMLVSSYEALRFQKLDLFTVMLRQIGAYIATSQLSDAVKVLLDGDGNSNAAAVTALSSTPVYSDFVNLWSALSPYRMSTVICGTKAMKRILCTTEFTDAAAGLNFQATGKMVTPLGAELIHVPEMADGKIMALDRSCALEMVQAGEVQVEYDKLIDRQLERAGISVIAGFAKIFDGAVKAIGYTES